MRPTLYLVALAGVLLTATSAHAGDETLVVEPTGLLQTWITAFDQDEDPQADPAGYGDPEADPGFALARARAGVDVAWGRLDGHLLFGVGTPYDVWESPEALVGVVDANLGVRFEGDPGSVRLSLGTQKVPFSREILLSSKDLLFQERSVSATWLSPNRETGLQADLEAAFGGRLRLGVYNGNGSLLGDDNVGVLAVARAEWATGEAYRTFGTENAFGVGVAGLYDVDVATTTAGAGADALARLGPVTLLVEGQLLQLAPKGDVTTAPPAVRSPTTQLGGTAQLSVFVPLDVGGLDVGARFSVYDDATKHRNNGDVGILHAGLTWREPLPGLDVGAGFIHREELAGRSIGNDTARLWVQLAWPGRAEPPAPAD